jgi:hypothetical protein
LVYSSHRAEMLTFIAANNGNTGSELPPHIVQAAAAQRESGELRVSFYLNM